MPKNVRGKIKKNYAAKFFMKNPLLLHYAHNALFEKKGLGKFFQKIKNGHFKMSKKKILKKLSQGIYYQKITTNILI